MKKLMILMVTIAMVITTGSVVMANEANDESYFWFGIGYNGDVSGDSGSGVSFSAGTLIDTTSGIGLSFGFVIKETPPDALDYDVPHNQYYQEEYNDCSFDINILKSVALADNVRGYVGIGLMFDHSTTNNVSMATGYNYSVCTESKTSLNYILGLQVRNGSNIFGIEKSKDCGISLQIGKVF